MARLRTPSVAKRGEEHGASGLPPSGRQKKLRVSDVGSMLVDVFELHGRTAEWEFSQSRLDKLQSELF